MGVLEVWGMIRDAESSRNLQLMEIQVLRKKISSGEEIQETPKEVLRAKKMNNQRPRN